MEFGSGHDVRPAGDITMDTSAGSADLGQTTYDANSDGVADSVIIFEGDHEYLITDSDSDGHADSIRVYDASGHEVAPSSGQPIDGATGSTGAGGSTGHPGQGLFGTDAAGVLDAGVVAGQGIGIPGADGTEPELGPATVDLDRDGTPDTTVVREPDGAVIGYTDVDGDGVADQRTRIGVAGDVTIAVRDGRGGWQVAATGHLDEAGRLVEDAPAAG